MIHCISTNTEANYKRPSCIHPQKEGEKKKEKKKKRKKKKKKEKKGRGGGVEGGGGGKNGMEVNDSLRAFELIVCFPHWHAYPMASVNAKSY